MKKNIYLFFLFCAIFTSCSKSFDINEKKTTEHNLVSSSYVIPQEVALKSAISFLNSLDVRTKAGERCLSTVDTIYSNLVTTKSGEKKLPSFYLFNFKGNEGFALMSADKRDHATAYIASAKGELDINNIEGTPYECIMNLIYNYQQQKINSYKDDRRSILTKSFDYEVVVTEITSSVGPLLQTKWYGGFPFNRSLNNTDHEGFDMGCASVAIAQIAQYYNYPSSYGVLLFNWTDINSIMTMQDGLNNITKADEVSRLIYAVGAAIGVSYNHADSLGEANFNNYVSGLLSLGYSCNALNNYYYPNVYSSLSYNRPVLMRGRTSTNNVGHAWVVDGYLDVTKESRAYDENGNLVENSLLTLENIDERTIYWHCNFGWKGNRNGMYSFYYDMYPIEESPDPYIDANVFNTASGIYDQPSYNDIYLFNVDLKTITNIRP